MEASRNKKMLIERLTPVQLANELANNGYVNYYQMIVEQNIDGKQFLNLDENKVQELKLIMTNTQVQLLWSFVQRIQKYPDEFIISNKPPSSPVHALRNRFNNQTEKNADNKLPSKINLKLDKEKRRDLLAQKPVTNIVKPIPSKKPMPNSAKDAFEKRYPAQSAIPPKPISLKQRSFPAKSLQQPSATTTENVTGNSTVSEELQQLKRSGSIQKRLDSIKKKTEEGSFPIFRNVTGKLPERVFANTSNPHSYKNLNPPTNSKPKLKAPINPPQGQSSSPTHLFKPPRDNSLNRVQRIPTPIKNSNELEKDESSEEEIYINEVPPHVETKISSDKIDDHFLKKKFEIQNEISSLHNGTNFKEKLKSLQEHFQGLHRDEEEESHYGNWTADQSHQQDAYNEEEVYRNWEADANNKESFDDDDSDNWDNDSESWDNSEESNSDEENQYINHNPIEESNFEEHSINDLPPPPLRDLNKPSTSQLPPKPINFRKLPSKALARPPVTLPDKFDITTDQDKSQDLYLETLPDIPNLYEPGPVLDKSTELDELIGKPSLPYRRLSSLLITPQERALPEIPVDLCNIRRKEAENLLMKKSVGTFIFRKSNEYFGAMTIKGEGRFFNIPIRKDVRGMYFDTVNEKIFFKDLNELMQFYKMNDFKVGKASIRLITMHT